MVAINLLSWVSIQDAALLRFLKGTAIQAQRCNSMLARCNYVMLTEDVTIHTFSCDTCHHLGSVTYDRQVMARAVTSPLSILTIMSLRTFSSVDT